MPPNLYPREAERAARGERRAREVRGTEAGRERRHCSVRHRDDEGELVPRERHAVRRGAGLIERKHGLGWRARVQQQEALHAHHDERHDAREPVQRLGGAEREVAVEEARLDGEDRPSPGRMYVCV